MSVENHWSSRFQQESTWTAVDEYAMRNTHPDMRSNANVLETSLVRAEAAGMPPISVSPAQGKLLALHCRAARVTHALEIGTLAGYSAIWLASENPDLRVTTIEYDAKHVAVARRNMELAGVADQVEVRCGTGFRELEKLHKEIEDGLRPLFGFVFIDADKVNNWNYFRMTRDMVKPNSAICVDNVVLNGELADMNNTAPNVVSSRELVERVGREPGVNSVVAQSVGIKGYDGWLWAVVS